MSKEVIKPNVKNGYSIYMLRLENGDIVHLGGYCPPYGDGRILCNFCGSWKRDKRLDTYFIHSRNGINIDSGAMCKSAICAKKYKEDKKKYNDNAAYLQQLLNIEDRLSFITFATAGHQIISETKKIAYMSTMHIQHISSFLSTNRDNNEYRFNYEQVNRDREKYRERCEAMMQKRINRDNRLPTLMFTTACHKAALPTNKINLLVRVMNIKKFHKMIIASFLSKEQ
jgi:hypothetical protein